MAERSAQFNINMLKSQSRKKRLAIKAKRRAVRWLNKKQKSITLLKYPKRKLGIQTIFLPSSVMSPNIPSGRFDRNGKSLKKSLPVCESNSNSEIKNKEDEFVTVSLRDKKDIKSIYHRRMDRSKSVPPSFLKTKHEYFTEEWNHASASNDITKLFTKYNKALKYILHSESNTTEKIEHKISELFTEIQVLNDMIKTKESEWDNLLYLRKIKEEIIIHLSRKKDIMEIKGKRRNSNTHIDLYNHNEYCSRISEYSNQPSDTMSLVENRANMNPKELEKEIVKIKRLQSILAPQKIFSYSKSNISSDLTPITGKKINKPKYFPGDTSEDNRRLIWNIKEDSLKTELYEFIYKEANNNNNDKADWLYLCNNESKTRKKVSSTPFKKTKEILNEDETPLCQACRSRESRFVCAGCANQWYCSRECQVSAWDKHSNSCH